MFIKLLFSLEIHMATTEVYFPSIAQETEKKKNQTTDNKSLDSASAVWG